MAGLEVVVRPVVFPNIRPAAPRALAIEDAPDKGIATISGGGGGLVDLPYSYTGSWSRSRMVEIKRTFDKVRMYYTRPDGTLDYTKYWEFEVLTRIEYLENGTEKIGAQFAPTRTADNLEIMQHGLTRANN